MRLWHCLGDLLALYELKKILGTNNNVSAQFIKMISHCKRLDITSMYCNRLHAWLATLLSSLIVRRRLGPQTL